MNRDDLRRVLLSGVARALPRSTAPDTTPRRLLLIRPDHLGDVLLTSPAVRALRESLPEAHLALMVGPWALEVARRGAAVDELLTCPFPGFTRRPKDDLLGPYRLLIREARRLRGRYDLAVVLRPDHWWGALLAGVAGISIRLGYDTPTTRALLTEALPLPKRTHVAQLNLRLAARAAELANPNAAPWEAAPLPPNNGGLRGTPPLLGGRGAEPVFRLSPEERAWADSIAREDDRPLVLLHAGSGSPLKNWPAERWAAVGDALVEAGARVVLTGGPDDPTGPGAITAAMRHEPLVLAGQTSLGQLGALAERSLLAVGTDNGPLHLAAALGTPTVRLYGPTDEAVFGPRGGAAEHVVLTHELACRPCGNLINPPCGARREPACMQGIPTERVVEAALGALDRADRDRR